MRSLFWIYADRGYKADFLHFRYFLEQMSNIHSFSAPITGSKVFCISELEI